MKIALLLALLSFLLFGSTAKSSSAPPATTDTDVNTNTDADADTVVSAVSDSVFDVGSEPVKRDTGYYIVAAKDLEGQRFDQSSKLRGKSCPHYNVVLGHASSSPLKFWPANTDSELVGVSSYLNIEFAKSSDCGKELVWKVDDKDKQTDQWFVTTGGDKNKYGDTYARNWFQIVKVGPNIYNIIYCPDEMCPDCIPKCQNVSHYYHKNEQFLALSADRPFHVKFLKA